MNLNTTNDRDGSSNYAKVYVIGLDSADPNVLEALMTEGKLPCLKSLADRGTMTRLSSIASGFSDAPWLSFNTGVRPGKHGCYNFLEMERETREIWRVGAKSCPYPFFWSLFTNKDQKIGLFDVPKTYPVAGLDGIQISAWGEEYPLIEACSLPKNLLSEIVSRFGQYRHPREILNPRLVSQQVRRYRKLMSAIGQKLKAIKFVMGREDDWDLFMTSFGEAHYANHLFYHLYDENHWAYEPQLAQQLGTALPDIYAELDKAVENLLTDIPEDATVFVLAVHGVSTNYSANHLLPEVLSKLGFQANASASDKGDKKNSKGSWRDLIPMPIRDFINDWLLPQSFHDKMHSQQFINSIDWENTKAFAMPLGHFQGFISINLKGRDGYGIVEPEDYDRLCQQIKAELQCLTNPDTGKPAISEITHISQLVEGERIDRLPDFIIQWAEDTTINKLHHPKLGIIAGEYYGLRKTQHTGNGFLIAGGQHIKPGVKISDLRAIDLPPTILHLMGQSVPEYMEGRVLSELIASSAKSKGETQENNQKFASL